METLKHIPENIREVRPHFLLSVPALAKNFRKNIEKSIQAKAASPNDCSGSRFALLIPTTPTDTAKDKDGVVR